MEGYEKKYYDFQTQGRGLLDATSLRRAFQRSAPWYGSRLKAHLPRDPNARCLDIACGYGNFLYFLRSRGYRQIEGCDLDPKQVELARSLDLPARHTDARSVLLASEAPYDCISALDFIEHLNKNAALDMLELCSRRLAPGGVLILRTPCADGIFGAYDAFNDLTHHWSLTSTVLRQLLAMQGLERIAILDERPQPYRPRNLLRLGAFHLARGLAAGFCHALGVAPPRIWSRAMWGIGYKPAKETTTVEHKFRQAA